MSSLRAKMKANLAGTGFNPSSSSGRDRRKTEPPHDWKSRLLPVEICREIDQFRNFYKTKGTLEFTIPDFAVFAGAYVPLPPPVDEDNEEPPSPPAKQRRMTRGHARQLDKEREERAKEALRYAQTHRKQMEERREAQIISPPVFIRGMAWRMDVRRSDDQLQVFLQCNGKGKWNWRTTARFLLVSRTGTQPILKHINRRIFHSHAHAWGFIPFAEIPTLLDTANGHLQADGSLRLRIDIDTSLGGYKTQETLRAQIPEFPAFISKPFSVYSNAVEVNGRPLRMLLNMRRQQRPPIDQPDELILELQEHRHLSCFFQYNNGEPLYDGEHCTIDAVYEVVGGVGGGYKARHQSKFFFHGNSQNALHLPPRETAAVLQGKYDFAIAENLIDPENGYLGRGGELDVVAYVFA